MCKLETKWLTDTARSSAMAVFGLGLRSNQCAILSDEDVYRVAQFMMHQHGCGAEFEPATRATRQRRPPTTAHLVRNLADDRADATDAHRPVTLTVTLMSTIA